MKTFFIVLSTSLLTALSIFVLAMIYAGFRSKDNARREKIRNRLFKEMQRAVLLAQDRSFDRLLNPEREDEIISLRKERDFFC